MAEWIPLVVAAIGASATLGVQFLLSRSEPSAINRIKLLSEAIASMPADDQGRASLEGARSELASRLARSLIGVKGFAKVLRKAAWVFLGAGTVLVAGWLIFIGIKPLAAADPDVIEVGVLGIVLLVCAPLSLVYSLIWPQIDALGTLSAKAAESLIGGVVRFVDHHRAVR